MGAGVISRPVRALRRLTAMVFRRSAYRLASAPRSLFNFLREVGDGTGSSTVMAPLLWVARTFPEAPPALWRELPGGQEERVRDHPMLRLLQRPNDFFTGPVMWMATMIDWLADGNAYWLKVRDRFGIVRELWWTPTSLIEPKGDDGHLISHYEYRPGADTFDLLPGDVVHFRFGIDGDDPKKGRSPLKSVLREVFTDDEAAAFTASLLRNMGVPGLIVSPTSATPPSPDDVKATKDYLRASFSGDRRGEPLVMSGPTTVQQFGFSPEQLDLRGLRRVPEERVTAVLGVPAIVAGLGAGLDRSTFTNMAEAREFAYESGIIPYQRIVGEDVRFQLLSEFERDVFVWRFGFDLTQVRVLQEDLYRQAQRLGLAVREGWGMVAEARRGMGLEVDEERDNIFLRQMNLVQVSADDGEVTPLSPEPAAAPSNGNGNGNGGASAGEVADEVVRAIERAELAGGRR